MLKNSFLIGSVSALFLIASCAAPLRTNTAAFKIPASYQDYKEIDDLDIALVPIDTIDRSNEIFGTDMKAAGILPIQVIIQNKGNKEFEIKSNQIYGITSDQEYTAAYSLNKAAEHVRSSSIGTTAVSGAVAGALVGAVVGAGIGAGIGYAGGNTNRGAQSGAMIGGATGAASGAGAGLSDQFTVQFKKELASLAFGDRVIYPGDLIQGFVYIQWKHYSKLRLELFNITDDKNYEMISNINLTR